MQSLNDTETKANSLIKYAKEHDEYFLIELEQCLAFYPELFERQKAAHSIILDTESQTVAGPKGNIITLYTDPEKGILKKYLSKVLFAAAQRHGLIMFVLCGMATHDRTYYDMSGKHTIIELINIDLDKLLPVTMAELNQSIKSINNLLYQVA